MLADQVQFDELIAVPNSRVTHHVLSGSPTWWKAAPMKNRVEVALPSPEALWPTRATIVIGRELRSARGR